MKRIFKYPTGAVIPEGAIYLSTIKQEKLIEGGKEFPSWLVWHYFLVEVEE